MIGRFSKLVPLIAAILFVAPPVVAEVVDPPITVALTVVEEPRNRRVTGLLVGYDSVAITLEIRGERERFPYNTLTPTSLFTARHRAMPDGADAAAWLDLARFGRAVGAERQSDYALLEALKLDETVRPEVDAIREEPVGSLRDPGVVADAAPVESAMPEGTDAAPVPEDDGLPPKFLPVSAEAAARQEELARADADRIARTLGVRLREVTTPHFMIFTDWDPVDDPWLAEQLEAAYTLLCREFAVPAGQPVFIGRLPVYMYHGQETMLWHAREIDDFADASESIAGYFRGRTDGIGRLVMSKPVATRRVGLHVARQMWRRTLTHEFVHAFLSRYRGNGFLPRWMNEGLAEMLAETIYPRPGALDTARHRARHGPPIASIFDDATMPGVDLYPVMMTLVVAMYREDPDRFVRLVDRVKAGEECEAVLLELYDVNYGGLELAWRDYMRRN